MAVSANVLRVSTTLRLGERVLARCDDGLLATEYVLFDASDIVLRATDPVTVRETGYITTAGDALARLARAGVTPDLALETARAMSPEVVASYARGGVPVTPPAAASIVAQLGPCELFDGAVYRAATQAYEGAWLDLRAVSSALPRGATAILQAMHLAAALDEVARSTPVHLATANATRDRKPGERTHHRVLIEGARELAAVLRRLEPNVPPVGAAEEDPQRRRLVRDALLARVRERASIEARPGLRAHLAKLEAALAPVDEGASAPLSDPELRAMEQRLASGDARGVRERLDELERAHGTSAAARYLRARAAFVAGDEPPNRVAQTLSVIANEDRSFHEAELVAARAWLAAGEEAYARHFARRLAEDLTARESERLVALEILDATSANALSQAPPPVVLPSPIAPPPVVAAVGERPPAPELPVTSTLPIIIVTPPSPPGSVTPTDPPRDRGRPLGPREVAVPTASTRPGSPDAPAPPGASLPPMATMPPPAAVSAERREGFSPAGPRARYEPELVESLALPLGATEDVLAVGNWPTTPLQARTAMTRLARSLARDYRLWYGTTLRCNVLAVDAMQRHLSQRYAAANFGDTKVILELQRHGALLSEILARSFGGDWADVAPSEPGYWAMTVPPATRCWPIGRVYRFVSLGRRERDLVSYFLDIEARTKP